jgi:transcriptional accessory protein Tex/SPT6
MMETKILVLAFLAGILQSSNASVKEEDAAAGVDALATMLLGITPNAAFGASQKFAIFPARTPSRRSALGVMQEEEGEGGGEEAPRKELSEFRVGDKVKGWVLRFAPFGAFCDIGATVDALLHVSEICDEYVSDPSEKLEEDQELELTVVNVQPDMDRIGVSLKAGDKTPLSELQIGQEVEATVKRIVNFGAFCDIGAMSDALLHISEATNDFVSDMGELFQEGDKIQVEIKEVDTESRRIGLSRKKFAPPAEETNDDSWDDY